MKIVVLLLLSVSKSVVQSVMFGIALIATGHLGMALGSETDLDRSDLSGSI